MYIGDETLPRLFGGLYNYIYILTFDQVARAFLGTHSDRARRWYFFGCVGSLMGAMPFFCIFFKTKDAGLKNLEEPEKNTPKVCEGK